MVNEKEEFEKWLEQADIDLDSAKYNFNGEKYSVAIFLCQQSVEKGLKALMIKNGKGLIRTHDLAKLGREVDSPENFLNNLVELSNSYTGSRYIPLEDFKEKEVNSFIKFAEEVLIWIRKRI
ncbi:HEPN domain-containing protein [Candidatus Pacearchaeota archaeon]|nr:HEPN domain-containing protein [Candidatus Pacearchaeota archaeon]